MIPSTLMALLFIGQTSANRNALEQPGLGFENVDLAGGKGTLTRNTSIMGAPDWDIPWLILAQPNRRLKGQSSQLAVQSPKRFTDAQGIYWDPFSLALNGENGLLRTTPWHSLLDTPVTSMVWERYAFSGNGFRLDFRRLMADRVAFSIELSSNSTDSSGEFRYQDITHQPYLSSIKRDSSRVPFMGRNLRQGGMHVIPSLALVLPRDTLAVHVAWLNQDFDDATRHIPTADSADWWDKEFEYAPFQVEESLTEWGWQLYSRRGPWNFDLAMSHGEHSTRFDHAPLHLLSVDAKDSSIAPIAPDTIARDTSWNDSLWLDERWTEQWSLQRGRTHLRHNSWLQPSVSFEGESRHLQKWRSDSMDIEEGASKRQRRYLGAAHMHPHFKHGDFKASVGMHRQAWSEKGLTYEPAYSTTANLELPWGFAASAAWQRQARFPDLEELYTHNTARMLWGNTALQHEMQTRSHGSLQWKHNALRVGFSATDEQVEQAIRLGWMSWPYADTLPASQAFRYENMDLLRNTYWSSWLGFGLGRWEFALERHSVLSQELHDRDRFVARRVADSPWRTYKALAQWQGRFVQDRLKVSTRWDAQWRSPVQDWGLNEDNTAVPYMREKVLMLDFEAHMIIASFTLFTRIDNFNHSIATPGAGYAPPGVNFRYGIVWSFDD